MKRRTRGGWKKKTWKPSPDCEEEWRGKWVFLSAAYGWGEEVNKHHISCTGWRLKHSGMPDRFLGFFWISVKSVFIPKPDTECMPSKMHYKITQYTADNIAKSPETSNFSNTLITRKLTVLLKQDKQPTLSFPSVSERAQSRFIKPRDLCKFVETVWALVNASLSLRQICVFPLTLYARCIQDFPSVLSEQVEKRLLPYNQSALVYFTEATIFFLP